MSDVDTSTLRQTFINTLNRITDAGLRRKIAGDLQLDFMSVDELKKAIELASSLAQDDGTDSPTVYADGGCF